MNKIELRKEPKHLYAPSAKIVETVVADDSEASGREIGVRLP
jgi:hypothetical protein